jgi:hypothetical protein
VVGTPAGAAGLARNRESFQFAVFEVRAHLATVGNHGAAILVTHGGVIDTAKPVLSGAARSACNRTERLIARGSYRLACAAFSERTG